MYIQNLIKERFSQSDFNIIDRFGKNVPCHQVLAEYDAIRSYLSVHHDNQSVAIKLEKDYTYFLIILSCLELGITYIPMKSDYPDSRVMQIQEDSKFKMLINAEIIQEILKYKKSTDLKPKVFNENNIAYIIFTSGSTGRPKGVEITYKGLTSFVQSMDQDFKMISKDDVILQTTEFTFDVSVIDISLFLTKNAVLRFSNFNNNILKLAYELETSKITLLNTVPNNLNMLLSDFVREKVNFSYLKNIFIGGARFSYGLYQRCLENFSKEVGIYNFYGPTEATVYSHYKKITFNASDDLVENNVSIGRPMRNIEAMIYQDGKKLPPFERGELMIGGVQLLKGYINNPEQSKSVISRIDDKNFYHTGDISFYNDKGEYFIVGRLDDTIKYRGFRINLLDIDSYVLKIPYVEDSTTIAVEHPESENQTIGFIILKEKKTIKELKKDMAEYLLDYQIPEKIIFIDKYPVNVNGKVDRKELKNQYLKGQYE